MLGRWYFLRYFRDKFRNQLRTTAADEEVRGRCAHLDQSVLYPKHQEVLASLASLASSLQSSSLASLGTSLASQDSTLVSSLQGPACPEHEAVGGGHSEPQVD